MSLDLLQTFLLSLHGRIRDSVVDACERQDFDSLSVAVEEDASDTIYAIDRVSEEVIVDELATWATNNEPIVLIAEGISDTGMALPVGIHQDEAVYRVIIDPIDGTRGLMYQKRSAWILTGVAPNLGSETRLSDIELSIMTEIPLVKQHLSDSAWARRGQGVAWERFNRLDGSHVPVRLRPSSAETIEHAYASIFRPFPGARDVLAAIDDDLIRRIAGPAGLGRAYCFEDQYTSTGGQMYELASGRDRFIADLRPLLKSVQRKRGESALMCAHPYDVCAYLVATEGGVELTGPDGSPLDGPLDTTSDIGWIGYANADLRHMMEPVLMELLHENELLP